EALTSTDSDDMAVTGGSSSPTDFRKNSQINVRGHDPQGCTYALAAADYRGFAYLQRGASAMERASYYFQGMPQTSAISHSLQGEFIDNWQFTDENDVAQLVYKPCGEDRNFNINTELRVFRGTSDPSKTSFISMDSTDASIQTTYRCAWITCPRRQ